MVEVFLFSSVALGYCSYLNINFSMPLDSLNEGLPTKKAK